MRRLFRQAIWLALCVGLAVGCQKITFPSNTNSDQSDPSERVGAAPTNEDPEVADYCKKKGWTLIRVVRTWDKKPLIYLTVKNPDKEFEDITITADDYKMIARSKSVQVLDLRMVKNTDEGLKVVAAIPQLEGISVSGDDVTDAGIKALAQAKSLDNIVLKTKSVTDAGIKELAALPKLRVLYLQFMTLDGSAFEAFAGSKTLELVTLEYVSGLTDEGAKHLAKLPNLNELTIGSGFGEDKLTSAGIKAIVDVRVPAKFEFKKKLLDDDLLEALVAKGWLYGPKSPVTKTEKPATAADVLSIVLSESKVTDKGMRAVLNCTNVTSMFLEGTGVTDEAVKKLSGFKKLDYLALGKTKVTAAGLEAIAALPIKHLSMEGCELSENEFKALGKIPTLEELWLSEAKMKGEWLQHISGLPKLRDLGLRSVDFDDAAAKHVSKIVTLERLSVNNTNLGDTGFQELLKLPKLTSLSPEGTKVSKEVYLKAKKDHPKVSMLFYAYDK